MTLLVLLAAPIWGLDLASRRGQPTLEVYIEDAALEDSRFFMTANQHGNSGTSFRRASWELKDGALYITLFSGLVRGGYSRDRLDVEIEDEALSEVRQVYPRDGSDTKLIYSK